MGRGTRGRGNGKACKGGKHAALRSTAVEGGIRDNIEIRTSTRPSSHRRHHLQPRLATCSSGFRCEGTALSSRTRPKAPRRAHGDPCPRSTPSTPSFGATSPSQPPPVSNRPVPRRAGYLRRGLVVVSNDLRHRTEQAPINPRGRTRHGSHQTSHGVHGILSCPPVCVPTCSSQQQQGSSPPPLPCAAEGSKDATNKGGVRPPRWSALRGCPSCVVRCGHFVSG